MITSKKKYKNTNKQEEMKQKIISASNKQTYEQSMLVWGENLVKRVMREYQNCGTAITEEEAMSLIGFKQ